MKYLKLILITALVVMALLAVYFWHRESVQRALADHELAELKPQIEQAEREREKLEGERNDADARAVEAAEASSRSAAEADRQRSLAVAASKRAEAKDAENAKLVKAIHDAKPPADLPDCLVQLNGCRETVFELEDESKLWKLEAKAAEDSYTAKQKELDAMGERLAAADAQILARDKVIDNQKAQLILKDKKIELLEGKVTGFWNRVRPHIVVAAGPVLCHDGTVRAGITAGVGWAF